VRDVGHVRCTIGRRSVGRIWSLAAISGQSTVCRPCTVMYSSSQVILPRDAMHKRGYAVARCLSVRLSRSCILSKRTNISSKIFHHLIATPFSFFRTKRYGNIPTGTPPPLMRASNAGGVDSWQVSGFIVYCQRCNRQMSSTRCRRTVASWWHSSLVAVNGGVCWW